MLEAVLGPDAAGHARHVFGMEWDQQSRLAAHMYPNPPECMMDDVADLWNQKIRDRLEQASQDPTLHHREHQGDPADSQGHHVQRLLLRP